MSETSLAVAAAALATTKVPRPEEETSRIGQSTDRSRWELDWRLGREVGHRLVERGDLHPLFRAVGVRAEGLSSWKTRAFQTPAGLMLHR
jgi:hypothetical protein